MKFNDAMYAKVGLGKAIEEANQSIAAERRSLPGAHGLPGSKPRVDDSHLDVNVQRRLAGITQHERGVQAAHGGMPIYAKSGTSMMEDDSSTSMESLKAMGVRPNLRGLFENRLEEKSVVSAKHVVLASKHDMGAADVKVIRPTMKEAHRCSEMLKSCGYGKTLVQQMESNWVVNDAPGADYDPRNRKADGNPAGFDDDDGQGDADMDADDDDDSPRVTVRGRPGRPLPHGLGMFHGARRAESVQARSFLRIQKRA